MDDPTQPPADAPAALAGDRSDWRPTPGAAMGFSFAALAMWFVVSQIVPAIVLVSAWAVRHGKMPDPAAIEGVVAGNIIWLQVASLVMALGVLGLLRLSRRLVAPSAPGAPRSGLLRTAGWVLGATAICFAAQWTTGKVFEAIGHPIAEQKWVIQAIREGGAAAFVAIAILAPVAEELVFRRIVFRTLMTGNGAAMAYLGSSLAFAVAHAHPQAFPCYVVIGLICAFAYARTGRLAVPILIHAVNNTVAFALLMQGS